MGDTKSGQGLFGMREENVARRIEYEMRQRGWSQERLAREMADAGYPIHQSAISKIINPKGGKRRTIGVEEAIGFAKVFGTSLESLALPLVATKSAEVKKVMDQIAKLIERRIVIQDETAKRWQKLRSLLADEDVLAAMIAELESEGIGRDVALNSINYWVEGSFIKGEALDGLHPSEIASLGETVTGNIDAIRELRELLAGCAPEAAEAFLSTREDQILGSGLPLAVNFLALLRRRQEGSEVSESELALAYHWIDLTIQSLQDLRETASASRPEDAE